jgi:hypothetical protein
MMGVQLNLESLNQVSLTIATLLPKGMSLAIWTEQPMNQVKQLKNIILLIRAPHSDGEFWEQVRSILSILLPMMPAIALFAASTLKLKVLMVLAPMTPKIRY